MIIKQEIKTNNQEQVDQRRTTLPKRENNFLIGFIGTNRTGKSSEAKNIVKGWKESNPNGYVLSFDPQDNFEDLSDGFLYVRDKEINEKIEFLQNNRQYGNLVILDDYRLIHRRYMEEEWLVTLMNFRAKWNVDIIYITHNPKLVINYLTYFTTHYYIFYTKAKEGSFEDKIPDYELCVDASALANAYVRMYGRGEYPSFPHVIVDTEKEQLVPVNINKAKLKIAINKLNEKENDR